jgi:hypothetical protein
MCAKKVSNTRLKQWPLFIDVKEEGKTAWQLLSNSLFSTLIL